MVEHLYAVVSEASRKATTHGVLNTFKRAIRFKLLYPMVESYVRSRSIDQGGLQQTCSSEGTIWFGEREPSISIPRPDNPLLRSVFGAYEYDYDPQRPFICELNDCTLIGTHGIAVTADDRLILDTIDHGIRSFVRMDRYHRSRNEFLRRQLRSIGQSSILSEHEYVVPFICSDWSYYHWVTEYLPKLRLLEIYEERTSREPVILIEAEPSSFVPESLALAGYGPERCVRMDELDAMTVSTMVIPTHRSHFFNHLSPELSQYSPSRADLTWVHQRMRRAVDDNLPYGDDNERIYISRQNATRGRTVENYDEVMTMLDRYGFKSYRLEDLSFKEQVALFSGAEVIVGPIGAGLVNMIFAENATILEIFPEQHLRANAGLVPHFYFLAQQLGFEYAPVFGENHGKNLIVDVNDLATQLDKLGL